MSKDNNTEIYKESDRAKARVEKYRSGKMSYREYLHDLYEEHYGSYSVISPTKSSPTKSTNKINKPQTKFTQAKSVKVYLRFKLKRRALGYLSYKINKTTEKITNEYIAINLHQIRRSFITLHSHDEDATFDDLFSHVISHEYIHQAILHIAGSRASGQLDNKHGKVTFDNKHIWGNGLTIEKDLNTT